MERSWKRKRMLVARAARMRAIKKERMSTKSGEAVKASSGNIEETGVTNEGVIMMEESSEGVMKTVEASGCDREKEGASGGNRETGQAIDPSGIKDKSSPSSDDNDAFDEEKAQNCFDDWIVSLPALDRKMLAVSLSQTFITRQKMKLTDAAREAASFVGVNEKTVSKGILFQPGTIFGG